MNEQLQREALNNLISVQDWLRYGVTLFQTAELYYGHGTDNACDEAAALIAHVIACPISAVNDWSSCTLLPSERSQVLDLFQQRIDKRLPSAYLTHKTQFADLPFYVDERVLVPRSPIAELIKKQFSEWINPDEVHHIMDMCTGSACIAIACAEYFPQAQVDAIDLSLDALAVAEINVNVYELADRVSLIHSDLFKECPSQRYHIIISNPPYVSEEIWNELPAEFHAEPKMGFTTQDDGLYIAKKILREARTYLHDNGILVLELGYNYQNLVAHFPDVEFHFVECESGGEGILVMTASDLDKYAPYFKE